MIYGILIIILALLVWDFALNKNIITPGVLFNGIFFITLLLYNFYLSYSQQVLSPKLLLTLLGCVICFNIPVFISYYLSKRKQNNGIENKMVKLTMSNQKELILFVIWAVIFVVEVIYNKGFPLLWKLIKNGKTYMDFHFPLLHVVFVAYTSILGAYSIFKRNCVYKWFYLATGLLIINRNLIITIFLEGFVFFLLRNDGWLKKKKNIVISLVSVVAILVGFSIIGNFRTGMGEFLKVVEFKSKARWLPTSFKWVYSYMCFSLSNLNNLFGMTSGGMYHGVLIFKSICPSFLEKFFNFSTPQNFLVNEAFMASTFAPDLYLDFGVVGVILFCLILGLLSSWIYQKAKKNEFFKLAYSVFAYCIIFIFFVNMLISPPVYFQLILIPILFCNFNNVKLKIKKIYNRKSD